MIIGVPKETAPGERRVALVPETVGRLGKAGHRIVIEAGAGAEAGFPDQAFTAAGATIGDPWAAELVAVVQEPSAAHLDRLTRGTLLVGMLKASTSPDLLRRLADDGITAFSLELLPRITRAQSMDVLSSQATVAGYKAVLLAAEAAPKLFPMMVTAAGTLAPAKVLVLGAGVAGLQAIATARRLGAVVSAFDVRPAVKEQVESLGAKFLAMENQVTGEGTGGYAKELSADQHQRELDFLAASVRDMDVVITTAAIPGKRAPILLTKAAVDGMRPGAIVVDLAAETGGNCELTQLGARRDHHGVAIVGPVNLPASVPLHASQMYSRNVATFVGHLVKDGKVVLDFADEITNSTCVTHEGKARL